LTEDTQADNSEQYKALVVDDDKDMGRLISRMLSTRGDFKVTLCSEPGIALVKAAQQSFDVVISDVVMPGMSGIELMKGIRTFNYDVPIILVTGTPSMEIAQQAIEFGAYQYFTKPLDSDLLFSAATEASHIHRIAQLKREFSELSGQEDLRPGDMAGRSNALDAALKTLYMAYQPIVRAGSHDVFGYEAFLRSQEPRLPFPVEIINTAHMLDRMYELSSRIRIAASEPFIEHHEHSSLFINLHPRELLDPDLISPDAPLTRMASKVILEVSEDNLLEDIVETKHRLGQIKELGFQICVDGLGSGLAGISNFTILKPSIIKLDSSLVYKIETSDAKKKIVQSLVNTCHELGILVVAVGIETRGELDTCTEIGCDLLQGYFLGKPGDAFPEVTGNSG